MIRALAAAFFVFMSATAFGQDTFVSVYLVNTHIFTKGNETAIRAFGRTNTKQPICNTAILTLPNTDYLLLYISTATNGERSALGAFEITGAVTLFQSFIIRDSVDNMGRNISYQTDFKEHIRYPTDVNVPWTAVKKSTP